jgi:hypothetical protein
MSKNSYCPLCGEDLDHEPFCSSCGDVSGDKLEAYDLHEYNYYIEKQMRIFGEVIREPVNYLVEPEPVTVYNSGCEMAEWYFANGDILSMKIDDVYRGER